MRKAICATGGREADAKAFDERAQCFVKEYSGFTATDDVQLNGKLTLGENTGRQRRPAAGLHGADGYAGGQRASAKRDGFTAQQRFFLAQGQTYCQNVRPERARMLAQTDTHSPGRDRVNGVLGNMPEFSEAFACHDGQPMVHAPACRVW